MRITRHPGILLLSLVALTAISARVATAQEFAAASVKSNTSGRGGGAGFQAGGRFVAPNATLRTLIAVAYGDPVPLDRSRVAGVPSWFDGERFDVEAKASGEFAEGPSPGGTPASGLAMLRALLAERFHLVAHWETRNVPVYSLIVRDTARPDSRLVPSAGSPGQDCLAPGLTPAPGNVLPRCGSYILLNTGGNQFTIHARGITMANFARNLQNVAGRVVADRTSLDGPYSFDLTFEYRPPSTAGPDDGIGAAIFTAVQEQLGLRLRPGTAPAQVLVIDSATRPTPD